MSFLTSRFMASATLGLALLAGQAAAGETASDKGQATTTTTSDTNTGKGAEDVARLDLAFKENPNDAKVRLAVKLAEQDPAMALLHIDLVNSEGGLGQHHIDKLASLAADAKDELVWRAYRASVENDLAFNDANRLQPMPIMAPQPEPKPTPVPAPAFKPASAPAIGVAAPSPFNTAS